VKGVAEGCRQAGAAIVGGEMAEMAGVYGEDEYDLVGFATGVVDRKNLIDGADIKEGDAVVGIASSGLHSNGFSLVRKIFKDNMKEHINTLLTPTKIYVKPVLELIRQVRVKGICNITGGGLIENVPRMMPKGFKAVIKAGTWDVPPIFETLYSQGRKQTELNMEDMYNTFNMGVGMVFAVDKADAEKAVSVFAAMGEKAFVIGSVEKRTDGEEGIKLCLN
jgi:phosphoribosylformylglycinamidine cyclo-ligase